MMAVDSGLLYDSLFDVGNITVFFFFGNNIYETLEI